MKTLDTYRNTNRINIGGSIIPKLTAIYAQFGDALIGVVNDPDNVYQFTVRIAIWENNKPVRLVDHLVRVPITRRDNEPHVVILETTVIHDWTVTLKTDDAGRAESTQRHDDSPVERISDTLTILAVS